jgi:hypothetical protein
MYSEEYVFIFSLQLLFKTPFVLKIFAKARITLQMLEEHMQSLYLHVKCPLLLSD